MINFIQSEVQESIEAVSLAGVHYQYGSDLSLNWVIARVSSFYCVMTVLAVFIAPIRAQSAMSESYDLGDTSIFQTNFAQDSRFYEIAVRIQGVLAVPEGDGPFPVVLFVHGAYMFCTAPMQGEADAYPCPPEDDLRQYEGFTYLAEGLAERGYIAIVPDLSAEFNTGIGFAQQGVRTVQIVNAHLAALEADVGFETDISGKVDLSELVIATHSRGGPLALFYLNADDASYTADALAMLTPAALFANADRVIEETVPETLPTALIIAECDGDVGTDQPLSYLDDMIIPGRPALTTIYTVPGATHNAFSTNLDADPSQECEDAALLDAQRQRNITTYFLSDFFDAALLYGSVVP